MDANPPDITLLGGNLPYVQIFSKRTVRPHPWERPKLQMSDLNKQATSNGTSRAQLKMTKERDSSSPSKDAQTHLLSLKRPTSKGRFSLIGRLSQSFSWRDPVSGY